MKKKHLFLQILNWKKVDRPAVWCMRQAWRYLPKYSELKLKYDFWIRVQTPELASEITIEPVELLWVDAAILFSDILVIPKEMWLEIELIENKWPIFKKTIQTQEDIDLLDINADEKLTYVYDAIKLTKQKLQDKVPLIWFAWAPFTILCYMVEWKWSKTFDEARKFCFTKPELALELLDKITDLTIKYLKKQVEAWVDAVQIFDSWSSVLSPSDFDIFIYPFLEKISKQLDWLTPVILFEKWANHALKKLSKLPVNALSLDWNIKPKKARKLVWEKMVLQWNFDPAYLFLDEKQIEEKTKQMIKKFWTQKYIVNLWHWILQKTPVSGVKTFVETVKNYK